MFNVGRIVMRYLVKISDKKSWGILYPQCDVKNESDFQDRN